MRPASSCRRVNVFVCVLCCRVPYRFFCRRLAVSLAKQKSPANNKKGLREEVQNEENYSRTMSRRSCSTRNRKNPGSDPVRERRCCSSPPGSSRVKWSSRTSCSTGSGCLEGEVVQAGAIPPLFSTGTKVQQLSRELFCKPSRAGFKLEKPSGADFRLESDEKFKNL